MTIVKSLPLQNLMKIRMPTNSFKDSKKTIILRASLLALTLHPSPRRVVVVHEPFDGLLQRCRKGGRLVEGLDDQLIDTVCTKLEIDEPLPNGSNWKPPMRSRIFLLEAGFRN
jgi:hypothetical protein